MSGGANGRYPLPANLITRHAILAWLYSPTAGPAAQLLRQFNEDMDAYGLRGLNEPKLKEKIETAVEYFLHAAYDNSIELAGRVANALLAQEMIRRQNAENGITDD